MASAYLSGRSWIADFRALHVRKQRRVRIPMAQIPGVDTKPNRDAAQAFADECERYVRLLEARPIPQVIDRAEEIGAITAEQAATLRGQPGVVPVALAPATPSIIAAAERHPSSQREPLAQAKWHRDLLARFIAWAKIDRVEQITLELVQRWISHQTAEGYAWDSRRHALLWLRRACAMAAKDGIPDPLVGFRLDKRKIGDRTAVVALARDDLVALLAALHPSRTIVVINRDEHPVKLSDHRPRLAVALGACLGLRPSETYRLRLDAIDLDRQALRTGHKNEASVRALPLPLTLCQWLHPLMEGRKPDDLLFTTQSPRGPRPFTASTWTQWLGPVIRTATGKDTVQAKSLRKTFATWAARDRWPAIELEAFLGHESSQVSAITSRSYLADYQVEELRPAAARVDALLRESLAHIPT